MKLFSKKAFTLLEILIVLLIIGIFAFLAAFSYMKVMEDSRTKLCQANQSTLMNAATVYSVMEGTSLQGAGGIEAQLEELYTKGYIANKSYFKCPSSSSETYDDYTIVYGPGGETKDVECAVKTSEHKWP